MAFLALALGFAIADHVFTPNKDEYKNSVSENEPGRVSCLISPLNFQPFSDRISKRTIRSRKFDEHLIPPYTALDNNDLIGKVVKEPILRGEPYSLYRLTEPDGIEGYWKGHDFVPKDKRFVAVTFKSPGFSGNGASWGYPINLLEGPFVDLVGTVDGKSKIVAKAAKLISIGGHDSKRQLIRVKLLVELSESKLIELLEQGEASFSMLLRPYSDFK